MTGTAPLERACLARVTEILHDLVSIDSVNPALPGATDGEAQVAAYIADFCSRLGMDVEQTEALPGRPNVLARLRTAGPAPVLLIEAHTDTVTVTNMTDGLSPWVRDGRLHGRGACDTKGGLTAALHALELLVARPDLPRAEVHLLGAIDEEVAYRGVLDYLDRGERADAAIVLEPTSLAPVIATKGCARLRLRAHGVSAHTSRPAVGRNAISTMARVVAVLEGWMAARTDTHPLCGEPTLTVSRIHGGTQINIVPDECWIEIDYRLMPDEDPADAIATIQRQLEPFTVDGDPVVEVQEVLLTDRGLDTPPDARIAQVAAAACRRAGVDDTLVGVPYGSDASKLSARGAIASIVLGPGDIDQAHAADEWVDLEEVRTAADIYAGCARGMAAG
jgi:acetylornithine deacetylase/succinyl-diaminopimelate desuccinylase-like protein